MKKVFIFSGSMLILLFILLIFFSLVGVKKRSYKTNYNDINLEGINKLMVVAHPDDEILWGGTNLIKDDYLVVCITCGSNSKRVLEFENVMKETGDAYVMLNYPDKTGGKRNNWKKVRENIIQDLKNIYGLKKWKEVVTHNPDGEYGHIHHKMTSSFITNIVDKNKLKYFSKYYSRKQLGENHIVLSKMSEELFIKKKELLDIYVTQKNTIDKFSHMIATEELLTYNEWMERY